MNAGNELAGYFQLLARGNPSAAAIDIAHNLFLVGAAVAKKPSRLLELGIGSAFVTQSLLHALRFNGKGRLTSVDNWLDWNGSPPPFVDGLRSAGVNVIVASEEEFVRASPDDAYDFLVSDADHFNSAAWLDQHLRIVEHDGFLFFHDTNQPRRFAGLATIERQISERGLPHFHFKESSRPEERCERGWLFVVNKKRSQT